jgi:RNA polymerase sigma-70 factor (ECF subfamily)
VLDKLDTFEGRSKFTTWVHKIAVWVALTELHRKHWRDVSLEAVTEAEHGQGGLSFLADSGLGPEIAAEQADMVARVRCIILEELTEKQRTALVAAQTKGMPISEVASRMGMKQNALYKLMHNARLRLKRRMVDDGLTLEDVLRAFEVE